jgi:hypothetical protein
MEKAPGGRPMVVKDHGAPVEVVFPKVFTAMTCQ